MDIPTYLPPCTMAIYRLLAIIRYSGPTPPRSRFVIKNSSVRRVSMIVVIGRVSCALIGSKYTHLLCSWGFGSSRVAHKQKKNKKTRSSKTERKIITIPQMSTLHVHTNTQSRTVLCEQFYFVLCRLRLARAWTRSHHVNIKLRVVVSNVCWQL